MPKIAYIEKRFGASARAVIDFANGVISEYNAMGFQLTLRQLYYQFVARGAIVNEKSEYKRFGEIINSARLAGQIDWLSIEDRGRNLSSPGDGYDSPAEAVKSIAEVYYIDLWQGQGWMPEVWVEKEALVGLVAGVCSEMRVPYMACKGYMSQSEVWMAGHFRFRSYASKCRTPIILHLGDHDPSGIDMTRDIKDRLSMFYRKRVEVRRLALNMDQIEELRPPPNPAKVKDSRFEQYAQEFGEESWELDALEPQVLAKLIRDEVMSLRDETAWGENEERERNEKGDLEELSRRYDEVVQFLRLDEGMSDE